jgi:hypothetical protein
MTNQHPITPPPELVARWKNNWLGAKIKHINLEDYILAQAAQWGADQELESCCEWLERNYNYPRADHPLRLARRPKPPSLKEQALAELGDVYDKDKIDDTTYDTIRKALEALPND